MSFTIHMNDQLNAKFQELYVEQTARSRPITLFSKPALIFQWGMSESLYLLADGVLLIDNAEAPDRTPESINSYDDYWAALVIIARWLNEPTLLDLLPKRPPEIPVCWLCKGSHWSTFKMGDGHPSQILCPHCGGLGWKRPHGRRHTTPDR